MNNRVSLLLGLLGRLMLSMAATETMWLMFSMN